MGFSLCTAFGVNPFKREELSEALLVTTVISSEDDNKGDSAMSRATEPARPRCFQLNEVSVAVLLRN